MREDEVQSAITCGRFLRLRDLAPHVPCPEPLMAIQSETMSTSVRFIRLRVAQGCLS
jgi:hypothetical protein